jgi:enolase
MKKHNSEAIIAAVNAMEVLDSRGNPTVRVTCTLRSGIIATASVPSGASTGEHEAVELRDGDKHRYGGKGVLRAVANVNDTIAGHLIGMPADHQADIDHAMIKLDGTANKHRLGANAILGVSMAVARAAAAAHGQPLYRYLGGEEAVRLPVPMMNILNGGKHANNNLDFQEFMVMPVGAASFSEALRWGTEVYHALKSMLAVGYSTAVGDEGGFAPKLVGNEEACAIIVEAVVKAGLRPGQDVAIALDPAASSFVTDGKYHLNAGGRSVMSSADMISLYRGWCAKYPIVSIEDGLGENDWQGSTAMTTALKKDHVQVVGDDIFVTNPSFIERGISEHAATSVLIKLNQIGTVTETIDAIKLCRKAHWGYIISHRSGETEDAFIATSRWPWAAARSRPERRAAASAWRNTIGCLKSRQIWAKPPVLSRPLLTTAPDRSHSCGLSRTSAIIIGTPSPRRS